MAYVPTSEKSIKEQARSANERLRQVAGDITSSSYALTFIYSDCWKCFDEQTQFGLKLSVRLLENIAGIIEDLRYYVSTLLPAPQPKVFDVADTTTTEGGIEA